MTGAIRFGDRQSLHLNSPIGRSERQLSARLNQETSLHGLIEQGAAGPDGEHVQRLNASRQCRGAVTLPPVAFVPEAATRGPPPPGFSRLSPACFALFCRGAGGFARRLSPSNAIVISRFAISPIPARLVDIVENRSFRY